MEKRVEGGVGGVREGKVSRRRLLKLAAYSVPAMQLLNVAASGRALALTKLGCTFPVRAKDCSGQPLVGYKARCCGTSNEHFTFQPDHCDEFISTGQLGKGFLFEDCQSGTRWDPEPGVCYTFTPCEVQGQEECYQVWQNCP